MTLYGKFGRNPDEGPIDKQLIMGAAKDLRVQLDKAQQAKREKDAQYEYAIAESYYVLLEQKSAEPPNWLATLVDNGGATRDGLTFTAHGPTRELALQRMNWQYALKLHNVLKMPWEAARRRASHAVFLDAGG